jgi:hypothetical protein
VVPVTATEEPGTTAPTGHLLAATTARLEELIRRANTPGNLDGLLAHHILSRRRLSFDWDASPMTPAWLKDNEHRFAHSHAPHRTLSTTRQDDWSTSGCTSG